MRAVSDELIVCTDDGSYGRKALVTEPLKELLEAGAPVAKVWAIGPTIMMKFVSLTTQPFGVPTIVSLNTIMIDGTGMCGGCRVAMTEGAKFVCVDGPEFDGHLVDWNNLLSRVQFYRDEEKVGDRALAARKARTTSATSTWLRASSRKRPREAAGGG